jgi:hypothetical protein
MTRLFFVLVFENYEPYINGALSHVQNRVKVLVAVTGIDLPALPCQKQSVPSLP